jgi:hypothetical protein
MAPPHTVSSDLERAEALIRRADALIDEAERILDETDKRLRQSPSFVPSARIAHSN